MTTRTLMTDGSLALVTDDSGETWVRDTETGAQSAALTDDEVDAVERELVDMSSVELTPAEVEVIGVKPAGVDDVAGDADPEGAYWVTAGINGLRFRLFASRHGDGRPGLGPCGDSLDDWCPVELRTAFGDTAANRLGRQAIAMART